MRCFIITASLTKKDLKKSKKMFQVQQSKRKKKKKKKQKDRRTNSQKKHRPRLSATENQNSSGLVLALQSTRAQGSCLRKLWTKSPGFYTDVTFWWGGRRSCQPLLEKWQDSQTHPLTVFISTTVCVCKVQHLHRNLQSKQKFQANFRNKHT